MRYFSITNKKLSGDFKDALFKGVADDNGLYIPESLPCFDKSFFEAQMNYSELAFEMMRPFVGDFFNSSELLKITDSAYTFKTPLVLLRKNLNILELFHGPTLAFKDYAVRFMARCMEKL
jgi:Threonine synthase